MKFVPSMQRQDCNKVPKLCHELMEFANRFQSLINFIRLQRFCRSQKDFFHVSEDVAFPTGDHQTLIYSLPHHGYQVSDTVLQYGLPGGHSW